MRIKLIFVGKNDDSWVEEGLERYHKRLKRYVPTDLECIPALRNTRNLSEGEVKKKEGEQILAKVQPGDVLVLLDEKGKERTSEGLAKWVQGHLNSGTRYLVLVVGGPYGFSEAVYARANEQMALSKLTFSHQMIRPFLTEQLYRAFTILKGEPYHHR
ncbi:MAG: 23S rRNA (pseudouridine(1915)-N(3))-methyltransferase RlmH [Salibacteraceae bacterium]